MGRFNLGGRAGLEHAFSDEESEKESYAFEMTDNGAGFESSFFFGYYEVYDVG